MLSKNDIEKALEFDVKLEDTAKILGCHVVTLRKYMMKYDLYSSIGISRKAESFNNLYNLWK